MKEFYRIVCIVLGCLFATAHGQSLAERNGIINATLLQNLKQFPHQVGIHATSIGYCSGSIITSNWILTAAVCVGWNPDAVITMMFKRLDLNISKPLANESFTVQVNYKTTVELHPSLNLALVQLPTALQFDDELAPAALSIDPKENLTNIQAVMPGIKQNTTQEAYGQFIILSDAACNSGSRTICTLGWQNSSTVPCAGVQGGGLLVNWPTGPRLVGVFSAPSSCLSYIKAEYTRISSVLNWIEGTIGKHVKNDGYF